MNGAMGDLSSIQVGGVRRGVRGEAEDVFSDVSITLNDLSYSQVILESRRR